MSCVTQVWHARAQRVVTSRRSFDCDVVRSSFRRSVPPVFAFESRKRDEMKKLVIALALLVLATVVVAVRSGNQPTSQGTSAARVTDNSSAQSHEGYGLRDYAATGRIPAYYESPPSTLPPTLAPELFTGNKKLAYQAAAEVPQTLAQLPCYCHCDRGHGHKSLHSCFESEHGENCGICIGEALMAYNLQKRAVGVSEIRKQIIAAYGNN